MSEFTTKSTSRGLRLQNAECAKRRIACGCGRLVSGRLSVFGSSLLVRHSRFSGGGGSVVDIFRSRSSPFSPLDRVVNDTDLPEYIKPRQFAEAPHGQQRRHIEDALLSVVKSEYQLVVISRFDAANCMVSHACFLIAAAGFAMAPRRQSQASSPPQVRHDATQPRLEPGAVVGAGVRRVSVPEFRPRTSHYARCSRREMRGLCSPGA